MDWFQHYWWMLLVGVLLLPIAAIVSFRALAWRKMNDDVPTSALGGTRRPHDTKHNTPN